MEMADPYALVMRLASRYTPCAPDATMPWFHVRDSEQPRMALMDAVATACCLVPTLCVW